MTLYTPNDELVLITWLKREVPSLSTQIATALPEPLPPTGFVTVRALPIAVAQVDVSKLRQSICSVDCWAAPGGSGSDKPQWGRAWQLHSLINDSLDNDVQPFGDPLTIPPTGPDTWRPARVLSVWAVTTPRRVENDPNAYAHLTFDVACNWAVLPA